MVVGPAVAITAACSAATTATTTTATTPPPATTAAPPTSVLVAGGAAAQLLATPLDGYTVEAAPAGTNDDLLTTLARTPGSAELIGSVDVRLVTASADSSTALVVIAVLRPQAVARATEFADAIASSLARGDATAITKLAGLDARYIEGPDPNGGSAPLRALVLTRPARLALLLAVQADRPALERLATALAPRLG